MWHPSLIYWRAVGFLSIMVPIISGLVSSSLSYPDYYIFIRQAINASFDGNLVAAFLQLLCQCLLLFLNGEPYTGIMLSATDLPDLSLIFGWVGGFSIFAFLTTLTREIIKDIEDFEGDMAYGRNTVPVITGIPASKIIVASISIITIALLYFVWYRYLHDRITLVYLSAIIVLPHLYVLFQLFRSRNRKELHSASNFMKIIMFGGILYSLVVKAILTLNLI